nr:hypothetical protein [Tanacetum cinerariifolium]
MADKETKSTMGTFVTNNQANYYLGITSITVNGKNTYKLKGKFLNDLKNNAFSGTNGKYAAEHIEYFLRIVDPIDLPNINHDKIRVVVFLISLNGDAWRCFDEIKGSITSWKVRSDEIEPSDEESFGLKETNNDDEHEIIEIFRIETNLFNYETPLCENFKEFNYLLKIDPDVLTKDIEGFKTYKNIRTIGIMNGTKIAYIVGNSLYYQDLEWYDPLDDSKLKEEALRNKAIMEGIIDDNNESSNDGRIKWDSYEIVNHDQKESEYENEYENEERYELFDDHKLPVCSIRRFEMIKYSFGQDEEYVAVKENEHEDLMNTSKDACRAYQEIFRMMDEG